MYSQSWQKSNLLFQLKLLKDKLAKWESGEKYIQMQKEHSRELAKKDRRIQELEKELARSHAETVDVRNKWAQTCEDVLEEKEKELAKKDRELRKMEARMFEALRQRDEALEKYHKKNLELYDVMTQLEEARGKNLELTARVNKDYTNSSKSSSMSPNHKAIQNNREKTDRKPGGQPGHIHHERKKREPDQTIQIPAPEEYTDSDNYKPTGRMIRKQLVLLHVTAEVVEYVTPEFRNQITGQRVHAAFPEGVKDEVNYDGSVKAAAYLLNNECYVSIDKTRTFLLEISDGRIDLSNGMICNLSRQFSEKTQEERNQIFLGLLASPTLHADFTFGRAEGKQGTVMVSTTPGLVLYQAREKKGHEGVKGSPVELYNGTLISDHESTFQNYGNRHQECMVHVERYLRSSMENEPGLTWNRKMLEWVQSAIHYWKATHEEGTVDEKKVLEFDQRYDEILKKAKEEYENEPPSEYFKEGYNCYKRMESDKQDYVLFLHDPTVAPTNNEAERAGRKFKRKASQAMGFRSAEGFAHFCDGLSVTQTWKAKGINLYKAVASRFNQSRV